MGLFSKKYVGIDIGSASIKAVEFSGSGKKKKLENYVAFNLPSGADATQTFHNESRVLASENVAVILQTLLDRAGIKTKEAAFSIPDFATFFTVFDLPPMNEAEIPQAVEFKARHYIPLPLPEVNFDWQIIEKTETVSGTQFRVLLAAVPNVVLDSYRRLADLTGVSVRGLEAEVFGLVRSSTPQGPFRGEPVCFVDIGWQSTTVSVATDKKLRVSFSFDFAGANLARELSKTLRISLAQAENMKNQTGLDQQRQDVSAVILPQIDSLVLEIEKICQNFLQTEGKKVEHVVLAGGTSLLFGLKEYLAGRIGKTTQIAQPFADVIFPAALDKRLKQLGPSFAVAVGSALLGAE
ncbi:MAG: type IV pilus assembly protein PilM [Patescibacteria group bacterium]|nr:type IV pilus assembly protein PilM [Patescibacteria group bacterium]